MAFLPRVSNLPVVDPDLQLCDPKPAGPIRNFEGNGNAISRHALTERDINLPRHASAAVQLRP